MIRSRCGGRRRDDAEAAIAHHRRGDAERWRWRQSTVPGHLRVVMGVDVDDPRHGAEPAGHRPSRSPRPRHCRSRPLGRLRPRHRRGPDRGPTRRPPSRRELRDRACSLPPRYRRKVSLAYDLRDAQKLHPVIRSRTTLRSPAQAGAYRPTVSGAEEWVPAFAGKRRSSASAHRPKAPAPQPPPPRAASREAGEMAGDRDHLAAVGAGEMPGVVFRAGGGADPVGGAVQHHGRHRNHRARGEPRLDRGVVRVARRIVVAVPIGLDHHRDDIRVVERGGGLGVLGVGEAVVGRPQFPEQPAQRPRLALSAATPRAVWKYHWYQ